MNQIQYNSISGYNTPRQLNLQSKDCNFGIANQAVTARNETSKTLTSMAPVDMYYLMHTDTWYSSRSPLI